MPRGPGKYQNVKRFLEKFHKKNLRKKIPLKIGIFLIIIEFSFQRLVKDMSDQAVLLPKIPNEGD